MPGPAAARSMSGAPEKFASGIRNRIPSPYLHTARRRLVPIWYTSPAAAMASGILFRHRRASAHAVDFQCCNRPNGGKTRPVIEEEDPMNRIDLANRVAVITG